VRGILIKALFQCKNHYLTPLTLALSLKGRGDGLSKSLGYHLSLRIVIAKKKPISQTLRLYCT